MLKVVETPTERLQAYVVRSIVFIEEQACPFAEEFDGLDDEAVHVLGLEGGEPVATGRMRWLGDWAKLERIAVRREARGRGLGHEIVEFMLQVARARGFHRFKMHAQAHLVEFYRQHGFEPEGALFVEAGIDHYLMRRVDPPGSQGGLPIGR